MKTEPMTVAEVNEYRDKSKAKMGPWKTDWAAMAKKTAVRRLVNWIPQLTEDYAQHVAIEEADDYGHTIDVVPELRTPEEKATNAAAVAVEMKRIATEARKKADNNTLTLELDQEPGPGDEAVSLFTAAKKPEFLKVMKQSGHTMEEREQVCKKRFGKSSDQLTDLERGELVAWCEGDLNALNNMKARNPK